MSYKVKLDIFEGPLDLLLYLIRREHVNIYDIPIASITEQYLSYLELMRLLDLNIAGDFIVMASTLIQIKAKMLLPQEENEQEEEEVDPRQELVERLLEYKKFKEAASNLKMLEATRLKYIGRITASQPQEDDKFLEANLFDLIKAFSTALKDVPKELFYEVIKEEFTVEQKIHDILHMLLDKSQVSLNKLFSSANNKLEIIATFLAILELIRLREIKARQKELFGEILIARNKDNILPYSKK